MRIALITTVGPMHSTGGLQDHAAALAGGLVRAGHEVEVIASAHPEGRKELELDGARWIFVDAPQHHLDPIWLSRSTEAFMARHADAPYDVVDSESSAGLGLVRAGVQRKVPFVITFHGNFVTHARAYARRARSARTPRGLVREAKGLTVLAVRDHFPRGNWRLFRNCEAIVPSHAQLADTIRSHRLRAGRTHVVPNGIDTSKWQPMPRDAARLELGLDGEAPLYVSVGRLNRGKGVDAAIDALAQVRTVLPEATLLVVGDGPEEEALRARAEAAGVTTAVRFTGRLDHSGVRRAMSASDALVFPTTHEEAAPLVLLQALACGVPVVASEIGAIPEVLADGGGILVGPGDVTALTEAMLEVGGDEELHGRLAEGGRRTVQERYTLEAMVDGTLRVFAAAGAR
jgi:glycosyltransferase involved in cell wall biosynthesis